MGSRLIQLFLFTGVLCTVFLQTSASCEFALNEFYGYTCELQYVNATSSSDIIDFNGIHIGGRTNAHVQSAIVSQTARLEEIPTVIFTTLFNLEQFLCTSNDVRRVDLPFCGPRMRIIQLNFNPLSLLQNGAFRGCRSLETLTLILADTERIDENVFADLPRVRELIMFGNSLEGIQGHLLRNQHQLEYVRLHQGSISSIQPGAFQSKEFLHELDLRINRIERIETGTFTNMLRLRTLNLGNNNIRVTLPHWNWWKTKYLFLIQIFLERRFQILII